MNKVSSESLKSGFKVSKTKLKQMTPEQLEEFKAQFNPDDMGFDGIEGIDDLGEVED